MSRDRKQKVPPHIANRAAQRNSRNVWVHNQNTPLNNRTIQNACNTHPIHTSGAFDYLEHLSKYLYHSWFVLFVIWWLYYYFNSVGDYDTALIIYFIHLCWYGLLLICCFLFEIIFVCHTVGFDCQSLLGSPESAAESGSKCMDAKASGGNHTSGADGASHASDASIAQHPIGNGKGLLDNPHLLR